MPQIVGKIAPPSQPAYVAIAEIAMGFEYDDGGPGKGGAATLSSQ